MQEAEAAIRALANPLKWDDFDNIGAANLGDELGYYAVGNTNDGNPDGDWIAYLDNGSQDTSPFPYKTRDAAKDACEIHRAVERWQQL